VNNYIKGVTHVFYTRSGCFIVSLECVVQMEMFALQILLWVS